MHVASADRFVSFKAGGDRTDDSFFFYRAGYRTGWADERTKTNVAPKDIHVFFFLVVGDIVYIIIIYKSMTSDAISVFPVVRRQKIISGFLCWNFCLFVHVVVALDGQARFSPPVRVGFGPICVFA